MRRGDIVTVAAPGDYGKPRPAVVIQADLLNETAQSTIVTSHWVDAPLLRLSLEPSSANGLKKPSQVQVNRLLTLPITKVGATIGRLSEEEQVELGRLLAIVIGLA
ncbi:MAG: type II toxin-antitoxin system PemK/MazF family toxin [Chromatiaceae bacterium]|nr:type II toxin-antitoxin system PemK/MazF family toxin [Chromatiaceae bacterium]MCF8005739.1 type II toxin-antitoxin system PemK/MazF family toxin [Chromatiaceae bacterium]